MRQVRYRVALIALVLGGCGDRQIETRQAATAEPMLIGRENLAIAAMTELRSGPPISGSLAPSVEATVRSEIMGPVERTFTEEGKRVRKGALLARINDTSVRDAYLSARSSVRTAESALQNAKRNGERASRLAQAGALADRDLETALQQQTSAEGTLADAQARLASAQQQLSHTQVRAPIDGIVSERQVAAGDVVQVGGEMFTIVDLRTLRLEATVPAEEIERLRVGTPVEFEVTGFDRRFTGRIERINPAVDPATRQVRIYVAIPNPEQTLVAGLFAQGRVATDARRAVAVPVTALDQRGTSPLVHRLNGGTVQSVAVNLGVRDEAAELVEVRSGLAEGDTVLLGSAQGIADGTSVRVSQEEVSR